jgi:hypothetical protein
MKGKTVVAHVSSMLQPEIISASAKGWKLFPIAAGTKSEALTKWVHGGPGHEATDNLAQIELWEAWRPGCNWGAATGKSGFFVVDTDSFEGWLWFMGKGLPTTYTVKTGNPDPYRLQYYFKMPAGLRVKNSASEIAPGVDVRGDGGMVLIAPSLHPSGNRYAVVEDCEIAEAPAWLIELVKDERPERVPVEAVGELTDAQRQIGLAIFKKRLAKYAEVEDGQWNNELTKLTFLAGRMAAAGVFTEEEAEEMMCACPTVEAYMQEEPRTVEANFTSGFTTGAASPWDGAETEGYFLDQAGFGDAPLPPGASLEPLAAMSQPLTVPSGAPNELTPADFWACLPLHNYINRRTREFWSVEAVNGHLKRFTEGVCEGMRPAAWLDMFRFVQQVSWQPAYPEIIEGKVATAGMLSDDPTGRIYNLFHPSDAVASYADASPWVEHVKTLYPDDAEHILNWMAYRIQNPGLKINHALVLGGNQGIGKDFMLTPFRYGVGAANAVDIQYKDLLDTYNPWAECTLLVVNEAHNSAGIDRRDFYERSKNLTTAPPETVSCRKMYQGAYAVPNVMAVVITSNNKLNGLHIDPDDRRYYVAWSKAAKQSDEYFNPLWSWMLAGGGREAVVGYLRRLDTAGFKPMAPPPRTDAWHEIVDAGKNPEEKELADALEGIQVATVKEIVAKLTFGEHSDLAVSLRDRKNAGRIPHMLRSVGFDALRNPYAKDGRWVIAGRRETLYTHRDLSVSESFTLANKRVSDSSSMAVVR